MACSLQSGARNLTPERITAAAESGLQGIGVSVDGLEELHDDLRGVRGSFVAAVAALREIRAAGLISSVNTQITATSLTQLESLFELFVGLGVSHWQIQLTVAMGRAADNPDLIMQPHQMLTLMPIIADLYQRGLSCGLLIQTGNNIGYFGPYEHILRGCGDEEIYYDGCTAGQHLLGIESDGTIKGCPSLSTNNYSGGNIRDLPLAQIWHQSSAIGFTRVSRSDELWGFCRTCYYGNICQGGCTWTSHSLLGRRGNNPYCHHRALELDGRGLRERVVRRKPAPGIPFDHGEFELIQESVSGAGQSDVVGKSAAPLPAHSPLQICRSCQRHIGQDCDVCIHCGSNATAAADAYKDRLNDARNLATQLRSLMENVSGAQAKSDAR
jgi:radical SAM protein with 4Fe4S-binding SPASM domain